MIRIVATGDLKDLLIARGIAEGVRDRIMKHGQIRCYRDTYNEDGSLKAQGTRYFDILIDRDANDLPDNVVTFLRNRAEVVYVAEWDMTSGTGTVYKGSDPGIHGFLGWPV